jgi:hypothetical protein
MVGCGMVHYTAGGRLLVTSQPWGMVVGQATGDDQ